MTVAEALTEPRGGSDFFATTTRARHEGDTFCISGQKRFVVDAEGADLLLIYGKVEGIEDPKKAMTAFLVERGKGVIVEHVYGLMGTRGAERGGLSSTTRRFPLKMSLAARRELATARRSFTA